MSTKQRIKELKGQDNNSTLVKPKEIDKDSEEKSRDINHKKDCELFINKERFPNFDNHWGSVNQTTDQGITQTW